MDLPDFKQLVQQLPIVSIVADVLFFIIRTTRA